MNTNYQQLQESYLFAEIAQKVRTFQKQNPKADIIRLGIGDVTLPLAPVVIQAMHAAVREMAEKRTFHGYGPEQGYDFLREAIQTYYAAHGASINLNEIFISDGAKSDLGNILDLFVSGNTVLIPDPVYPVYVDTNIMHGNHICYLQANEENAFLPMPPKGQKADLIYLCSPNNPTGAAYNRSQLQAWVDYAKENDAIILYDAAYECFITDPTLPRSIFEIEGANTCAIEFCSFSKMAGFTGTRCGWTVVPDDLYRENLSLRQMWLRRQTTKFNGVSYIVQRGAEAALTEEGQKQVKQNICYYKENARIIAETLDAMNIFYTGGKNSPYLWMKCPNGLNAWAFFHDLLEKANIVGTPGIGFGENGKNFFRLTAFGDRESTYKAAERLRQYLK